MFSKFIKMDSENHYRLVMTNPIKGECIYKTKDIKKAGRKAFANISKKFNINKSLITLMDLNTNKEYKFLALKPPYINVQSGGAATDNKAFMDKIKNITETLDKSLESLDEAIEEKQQKDDDNNIILIAKDGISKLDEIINQLDNINKKIDSFDSKLKEAPKEEKEEIKTVKEDDKKKEEEDKIIKKERLDNKNQGANEENLLQPLLPPFEGENLCVIMYVIM